MALEISAAATEESTPPESPSSTRPSPTVLWIDATASRTKADIVQSPRQPQMSSTKLRSTRCPSSLWVTSGWNCTQ